MIIGVRKTRRGSGSHTNIASKKFRVFLCSAAVCSDKEQQNENLK